MSFAAEGILNVILIVVAVLFGVLLLWIHNRYEQLQTETKPILPAAAKPDDTVQ
ncbi:MAG: hypothetical protein ACK5DG_09820 [Chitinophagaceae bacterium]